MNGLPEEIIIHGVAIAPLVSVVISILKGWLKVDSKYIPLVNVILGGLAVGVYGILEQGLTPMGAITMVVSVIFGSQIFHETFGHAGKAIKESFSKP